MMKQINVKKKGRRKAFEHIPETTEQLPLNITDIKNLDHQYQHFDQFTKHSIRK